MEIKKNNSKILVTIIVILAILVILGGYIEYDKFLSKKTKEDSKNNIQNETTEIDNTNNIETIIDDDTTHKITTFNDIVNVWDNTTTKNKSYKIQNVILNNKKASLYIDYTFKYEQSTNPNLYDLKTTGTSTFTIKHGNSILYEKETGIDQEKDILQYLNIINDDYLIYGSKICSSYDSSNNCLINKTDEYNTILLINYNQNNNINEYFNEEEYYIYNITNDDNSITINTLSNSYGSGMYSCDIADDSDIQRIYKINYLSQKFSDKEIINNITYKDFCNTYNEDNSIF